MKMSYSYDVILHYIPLKGVHYYNLINSSNTQKDNASETKFYRGIAVNSVAIRWTVYKGKYVLFSDADIGNINYGYTGKLLFPLTVLYCVGNAAGLKIDPSEDKATIKIGYDYAVENYL